ncbi:MAG TPA: hypothetical protein VM299_02510 [Solirubrobacteraceae bacterium]|nr:hypothetical protein [Solirubrobacteraceae bacterium]
MKRALIAVAVTVVVLALSAIVARWLSADTDERAQVVELLRAQARGDAPAMLRLLRCRDAACVSVVRDNARRLRGRGELRIVAYQSGTGHAVRARTRPTRVAWLLPERLPTVQCVLVRRTGNLLSGTSVSLLRLSAPIGRESSCS